jgi:hypothetical protein
MSPRYQSRVVVLDGRGWRVEGYGGGIPRVEVARLGLQGMGAHTIEVQQQRVMDEEGLLKRSDWM